MVDYIDALKRPFLDAKKFIIGALLSIFPIVNFFAMGYIFYCIRTAFLRKNELPKWANFLDLFVKGFLINVILSVWLIPIILIFIFSDINTILSMTGIIIGTISFISAGIWYLPVITLLLLYLMPLAVVNYAIKNRFIAAFDFPVIFKIAFTAKYLLVWLISAIIGIVLVFLASSVVYANAVLAPAAFFAAMVIAGTLMAQLYRNL